MSKGVNTNSRKSQPDACHDEAGHPKREDTEQSPPMRQRRLYPLKGCTPPGIAHYERRANPSAFTHFKRCIPAPTE
jgi:hypothetical protein